MMELINNRGMRDWMIFIKVAEEESFPGCAGIRY